MEAVGSSGSAAAQRVVIEDLGQIVADHQC
jgi:hypothetical protein